MPITGPASTKEALADAYVALADRISLHTGNPGTTGANEAAGGGYARATTVWGADTTDDGVRAGSQVTIAVPAGTYTHVGLNKADGSFFDGYVLPAPVTLSAAGEIKVTPTYTQS